MLKSLYIDLYDAQYKLGKPSIAAVDGAARGGGMTIGVSCDVVIASEQATFGYPEIEVGLIPGIHFTHLPRIVGRHRAFELLFSGRAFPATEAQSLGIVSKVVESGEAMASARVLARSFAAKSPTVMRLGRAAFMRANDLDYRTGRSRAQSTVSVRLLVRTMRAKGFARSRKTGSHVGRRGMKWSR